MAYNPDFNIPDLPGAHISGLPNAGVAVYQGNATRLLDFCEALRVAMEPYSQGSVKFENIDVSKVAWDSLHFSLLCDCLVAKEAVAKRFKAYRTGIDDDCLTSLAEWFAVLPAQGMPSEIHLSHNKITQNGFDALFAALEDKRNELNPRPCPIWLRVENNSVPPEHASALASEGRLLFAKDIGTARFSATTAVCAMPTLFAGQSAPQQQTTYQAGGKAAGKSWQQPQQQAWGQQPRVVAPQQQAWGQQPQVVAAPRQQVVAAPRQVVAAPQRVTTRGAVAFNAFAGRTNGSAGSAADRSRTPGKPKQAAADALPFPWEEHWSDEYGIPYFWNADTGESLWQKPEA
jgi:hypothetical protein